MQDSPLYPLDYRLYLKGAYESRSARNPRYSLRAYARDLGIGASTLTEILKGKYGFSRARTEQIAKALQLSAEQTLHFFDLVQQTHARRKKDREFAEARISDRLRNFLGSPTPDAFKIISDWYHLALLELLSLESPKCNTKWLAKKLGFSEIVITEALIRMEKLGLVEKTKSGFRPTHDFSSVGDDTPSEYIRKFHKQILRKALMALDLQSVQSRDHSSVIFAINKKDIPLAKKKIIRFRRELSGLLAKSDGKDDVYCLGVQFFSLLEKEA